MGDQRADHGLLRLEAGVRRARWRLAEHQLQQAANDVQVGGLGPITDRTLRACRNHRGLLEQRVMLVLQLAKLTFGLFQDGFQSLAFDQHGLPCFQRDEGMGDALAAGEEKAGPLLGVVLAHPALQIDMAYRQIRRFDQRGVARRDAVLPEGQFPVEDAVIDAVGVQPQFAQTRAVQRLRQIHRRRDRSQDHLLVSQQSGPADGRFERAVEHL